MTLLPAKIRPIREIRFTRQVQDRSSVRERRLSDRLICQTVAGGLPRPLPALGPRGGRLIRFEKPYLRADGRGERRRACFVLCEVAGDACLALTAYSLPRPAGGKAAESPVPAEAEDRAVRWRAARNATPELALTDSGLYLRLQGQAEIVRTVVRRAWPHWSVDLDARGEPVGIEMAPMPRFFAIRDLARQAGVLLGAKAAARTRIDVRIPVGSLLPPPTISRVDRALAGKIGSISNF